MIDEIQEVINDKAILTRGQLEAKYENFAAKYPKTWVSIIDDTIKIGYLRQSVESYETMFNNAKGRTYQEKKLNADIALGEEVASKYLYPITGRPDDKSLRDALYEVKTKVKKQEEHVFDKSKALKVDFD